MALIRAFIRRLPSLSAGPALDLTTGVTRRMVETLACPPTSCSRPSPLRACRRSRTTRSGSARSTRRSNSWAPRSSRSGRRLAALTSSTSWRHPTRRRSRASRWSWARAARVATRPFPRSRSTTSSPRSSLPRVLVVGSGGREHAIVRALRRSPQRPEVLCAPGNPGIARDAAPLEGAGAGDVETTARAAARAGVDLVVVGPEVPLVAGRAPAGARGGVALVVVGPEGPLVAGLADACAREGVACFGPLAAAARLEGSKAYAKEVMNAAGVPTARHALVATVDEGLAAIGDFALRSSKPTTSGRR